MDAIIQCCHKQKESLATLETTTIPSAEKLLRETSNLKTGKRPTKTTSKFLGRLFHRNKVSVVEHRSVFIAQHMLFSTLDAIGDLTFDECRTVSGLHKKSQPATSHLRVFLLDF
jgi:hypothetical protein